MVDRKSMIEFMKNENKPKVTKLRGREISPSIGFKTLNSIERTIPAVTYVINPPSTFIPLKVRVRT